MLARQIRWAMPRKRYLNGIRACSNTSGGEDDLIRSIMGRDKGTESSGSVLGVRQHTVTASGLKAAKIGAVVDMDGALGVVQGLHSNYVTIAPIDSTPSVRIGGSAQLIEPSSTDIPSLFNRIIDPLGRPLTIHTTATANVFKSEAGMLPSKQLVQNWSRFVPGYRIDHRHTLAHGSSGVLHAGNPVMDAFYPIPRGDATCITGGPETDKSRLVTEVALNNTADVDLVIYVSVGKSVQQVHAIHSQLTQAGRTAIVVAAPRGAPAGCLLYAPLTGMVLGQVAASMGKHVLCIMDDLRDHAGAYNVVMNEATQPSSSLRALESLETAAAPPLNVYASLLERCGFWSCGGSLSAVVACTRQSSGDRDDTVISEVEDSVAEHIRTICGGEVRLSSRLSRDRVFPPFDVSSLAGCPRGYYLPQMNKLLRTKAQRIGHAIREARDLKEAIATAEAFGIKLEEESGEDFTSQAQVLQKLQALIASSSEWVDRADPTSRIAYENRINDMLDEMLQIVKPLDVSKHVA